MVMKYLKQVLIDGPIQEVSEKTGWTFDGDRATLEVERVRAPEGDYPQVTGIDDMPRPASKEERGETPGIDAKGASEMLEIAILAHDWGRSDIIW